MELVAPKQDEAPSAESGLPLLDVRAG